MKRGTKQADAKTSLSFEEKITAAWSYHVKGIDQHTLAAIFNVNAGRVAEACRAVEVALKGEKAE